jgi:Zn-dependent membrane protease YugP
MFGFIDPLYLMIVGPTMLLALWAQMRVKSAFGKWSQVAASSRMTGAQAAQRMLQSAGLGNVGIEPAHGFLSDHYDPRVRKLRLSANVYEGRSVAAMGIACHEAGHALQHAKGYAPLQFRTAIVPVASIGSWLAWPLIMIGLMLQSSNLAVAGIVLFAGVVLFQMVTLPVEFDASNRAKEQLRSLGIIQSNQEAGGVAAVLNAAALTYVAATVAAIAQLLYFAMRAGLLGGRRD